MSSWWWPSWVYDALGYLGLYYKNATILFLGLDNAGKTTLLQVLKSERVSIYRPTFQPNSEELVIGNVQFKAHDLGGHEAARLLWKDYYTVADGIVFMVDALDRDRFPEAKQEINQLLNDATLGHIPFVILGNKVDVTSAASEEELRDALGLYQTYGKDYKPKSVERPVEIFMCSVVRKMGYADGFKWLSQFLS